jgi:hypothetical protein
MNDRQDQPEQQPYYLRVRGRILGPFSVEKLRSLRTRGQFSRIHEISTDRRAWSPASSIDHLFSSPATATAPAQTPMAVGGVSTDPSQPTWLTGHSANYHRSQPDAGTSQVSVSHNASQPVALDTRVSLEDDPFGRKIANSAAFNGDAGVTAANIGPQQRNIHFGNAGARPELPATTTAAEVAMACSFAGQLAAEVGASRKELENIDQQIAGAKRKLA